MAIIMSVCLFRCQVLYYFGIIMRLVLSNSKPFVELSPAPIDFDLLAHNFNLRKSRKKNTNGV